MPVSSVRASGGLRVPDEQADEGYYCDEGENGPDEPDAGSEEEPDVPDCGYLSSLPVQRSWSVSRKLREEWAVRNYTISNERPISKQTESTLQPCGSTDRSPHPESGSGSQNSSVVRVGVMPRAKDNG